MTCDFRGGSRPPDPPSGSMHGHQLKLDSCSDTFKDLLYVDLITIIILIVAYFFQRGRTCE